MAVDELAFFGKIAAGVTHELKNVLAVIKESNGLMADLIAFAKDSPFPQRERFLRCMDRIDGQIGRGVEITSRFNRFSHSMDNAVADIDLNELVAQTVALTCRFARLKEIELLGSPSDAPVMLTTSPFRLQMALTKAIEACIESMPGKGTIRVSVQGNRPAPRLAEKRPANAPCLTIRCETLSWPNLEGNPDAGSASGLTTQCETGGHDSPCLEKIVSTSRPWQEFGELAADLGVDIDWSQPDAGFMLLLSTDMVRESGQPG